VLITAVDTFHLRHELRRPVGPASAFNTSRQTIVIRVATDAGLVGWGEAYALAGVRAAIHEVLGPLLIGQDPTQPRRLWQRLWDATFGNGFAVGGVDIALHDLWGKSLGVPIHRLFGGARRTFVPAYASSGYLQGLDPAEQWPEEVAALLARGYRAIKLKIGLCPPAHELPILAELKRSMPEDAQLMVDVWGAYTPPLALEVGRELQRLGIAFYEEPLPQAGYVGYEHLTAALDMPVAGGEMLQTRSAFKELFDRRAVDIVQPDVCICGGLGEVLFVADLARLSGIQCIPHSWNGAVMNVATLHVASLLADASRLPGVAPPLLECDSTENPFMTDELVEPLELHDGGYTVPDRPGLGVEIDEAALRRYAVAA
jgi:D-galactarolactone cycloisomerase